MFTRRTPFIRFSVVGLVLVMMLSLGLSRLVGAQIGQPPAGQGVTATSGPNLLANPNFDQAGFYFRMPNSLIPPKWYRWDVTPGAIIPEFIDGGTPHHNSCYPAPASGQLCVDMTPKNRSLGYIKYGGTYIAGAWQPVQVTACMNYEFSGYVRTDAQGYNPKVGLDPTGWKFSERVGDFGCPPPNEDTGEPGGQCYKEHFPYESDMPTSIVWSAPFPYDPPPPPIVWRGPIIVTAEALSTTITAWTYAAPTGPGSQSTYWDSMSLYQLAKPTLAQGGAIPAPDGTLDPMVTPGTTSALVQWNTSPGALSQVFYRPQPTPVSITVGLTYTVYLPIIYQSNNCADDFANCTPVQPASGPVYSVSLVGLQPGTAYDYVVMSRRVSGSSCVSSASATGTFTTTLP